MKTLVENLLATDRVARILIRPHPVAAGLIYRSDVDPDLDEVWRFYQRPGWDQTLRTFSNIDEDEPAVLAETLKVIAAIRRV